MAAVLLLVPMIIFATLPDRAQTALHACSGPGVSLGCTCSSSRVVNCENRGMTEVPDQIPTNTRTLSLTNNLITRLVTNQFPGLTSLQSLNLNNNSISTVDAGAFEGLGALTTLNLENNALVTITAEIFEGVSGLNTLDLDNNEIRNIGDAAFGNLSSVTQIQMRNNSLDQIKVTMFRNLTSVQTFYLSDNPVKTIEVGSFGDMSDLDRLDLSNTDLTELKEETFVGALQLKYLVLENSKLRTLEPGCFAGLDSLYELNLQNNQLQAVESGVFSNLTRFNSLHLEHNPIEVIRTAAFVSLPLLRYYYMSDMSLKQVEENAFVGTEFLASSTFDIQNNLLKSLPQSFCDHLGRFPSWTVDVSQNPFRCDCQIKHLRACARLNSLVRCETPPNLNGQALNTINELALICTPPRIEAFDVLSTVAEGDDLTVFCNATGFPAPSIGWITPRQPQQTTTPSEDGLVTVSNVNEEDSGVYICNATNPGGKDFAVVSVTVTPTEPSHVTHTTMANNITTSQTHTPVVGGYSTGVVVGIAIGCILGAFIISGVAFFFYVKCSGRGMRDYVVKDTGRTTGTSPRTTAPRHPRPAIPTPASGTASPSRPAHGTDIAAAASTGPIHDYEELAPVRPPKPGNPSGATPTGGDRPPYGAARPTTTAAGPTGDYEEIAAAPPAPLPRKSAPAEGYVNAGFSPTDRGKPQGKDGKSGKGPEGDYQELRDFMKK